MSHRKPAALCLRALCLLSLASACTSPAPVQYTGPWLRPSPMLRLRIDSCARRMPWAHGMERVELIAEFAQLGEPAYPVLLELCQDPRQDVAGDALAALGASGDVRLISVLHELPWPSEEDVYRRMERARTLMRLGDHSMAPHLIGGLEHKELFVRASCLQSLEEASGQRFGFVPSGTEAARAESVQRWRAWWTKRSAPV